jgi:hypothetical protein
MLVQFSMSPDPGLRFAYDPGPAEVDEYRVGRVVVLDQRPRVVEQHLLGKRGVERRRRNGE